MVVSISYINALSGQLQSLSQNFLKDRKQQTVLNFQCSSWADIWIALPPGLSILGPLVFLMDKTIMPPFPSKLAPFK